MKTLLTILLTTITLLTACGDSTSVPTSLTICTYNVEDFNLSNDSYNKVAAFVQAYAVDMIFLQEVQPGNHPNNTSY